LQGESDNAGRFILTKAKTVAQRRGRKRKEGPRQPNGQLSRIPVAKQVEMQHVVLEARARHLGLAPTPEVLHNLRGQPWLGCLAGRMVGSQPDVVDLWGTITLIRQRRRAWLLSIGTTEHPLVMRWQSEPERIETRPDDAPSDLRTDEERAVHARRQWNEVEGAVWRVDPSLAYYVERVVCRDEMVNGPPLAAVLRMIAKELA
jgi:hypothetical protein